MPEQISLNRPALLGGEPACGFAWPVWPIHDETEEAQVLEVLRSGQWWFGEKVRQFEREFAAFQGAAYGVTCTNGTTAIEMGLRALGVVGGDEVIVPPYTFIATASAVVTIGAIPVFADIEPGTLCLDPEDVQRKISQRTRAVIPVHVSGRLADMVRINELAESHNLAVLEDAAHAWGSRCDAGGAGTLGRCGTFSFQVSKNLTAGEGGILVTNDKNLADLCRSFTHCGRTEGSAWYDHNNLGSNLRITEFQAGVLLAQLARLEDHVARRQRNAALLDAALADIPAIVPLSPAPRMTRRSYHMYIFRLAEAELGICAGGSWRHFKRKAFPHRKAGIGRCITTACLPTPTSARCTESGRRWPAGASTIATFPARCANRYAATPCGFRKTSCSPTNRRFCAWPRRFAKSSPARRHSVNQPRAARCLSSIF